MLVDRRLDFGWVERLKKSARNCIRRLSPMGKLFITAKSTFVCPGPSNRLRETLPVWPPGGCVNTGQPPAAGGWQPNALFGSPLFVGRLVMPGAQFGRSA